MPSVRNRRSGHSSPERVGRGAPDSRIRENAMAICTNDDFGALLRCGLFMRATLGLPPPPSDAEIDRTVAAAVETWLRAYAV